MSDNDYNSVLELIKLSDVTDWKSTYHIVVLVLKSVLSDIVLVFLRAVDDNDLFLNELDELDIRVSLTTADFSVGKLSDGDISDDIVVVVVVVS